VASTDFNFEVAAPGDTNVLRIALSSWEGAVLDMDIEVSYDGAKTWHYGGGCRGAQSTEPGIEFRLSYKENPTHVRGTFSSENHVASHLKVFAGD
jgi:hypothetical protein